MCKCAFSANLNVTDAHYLLSAYRDHAMKKGNVSQALLYFATNIDGHPEDMGFKLTHVSLRDMGGFDYELRVQAQVSDEMKMKEAAIACFEENFGTDDALFNESGASMWLQEIVLNSNKSPSPGDLGYTIVSCSDAEPVFWDNQNTPEHTSGPGL